MPLTRSFKDTVKARAKRDPAFCQALITEAEAAIRAGDANTAKAVLRNYVNTSTDA